MCYCQAFLDKASPIASSIVSIKLLCIDGRNRATTITHQPFFLLLPIPVLQPPKHPQQKLPHLFLLHTSLLFLLQTYYNYYYYTLTFFPFSFLHNCPYPHPNNNNNQPFSFFTSTFFFLFPQPQPKPSSFLLHMCINAFCYSSTSTTSTTKTLFLAPHNSFPVQQPPCFLQINLYFFL